MLTSPPKKIINELINPFLFGKYKQAFFIGTPADIPFPIPMKRDIVQKIYKFFWK
jgi:hypothetical protein